MYNIFRFYILNVQINYKMSQSTAPDLPLPVCFDNLNRCNYSTNYFTKHHLVSDQQSRIFRLIVR